MWLCVLTILIHSYTWVCAEKITWNAIKKYSTVLEQRGQCAAAQEARNTPSIERRNNNRHDCKVLCMCIDGTYVQMYVYVCMYLQQLGARGGALATLFPVSPESLDSGKSNRTTTATERNATTKWKTTNDQRAKQSNTSQQQQQATTGASNMYNSNNNSNKYICVCVLTTVEADCAVDRNVATIKTNDGYEGIEGDDDATTR